MGLVLMFLGVGGWFAMSLRGSCLRKNLSWSEETEAINLVPLNLRWSLTLKDFRFLE